MLKRNEWSDGIEQGQPLWFVDDQLQVPDQDGEVHGPGRAERTRSYTPITDAIQKIALLFFLNEHASGSVGSRRDLLVKAHFTRFFFSSVPVMQTHLKPCDSSIEDKRHPEQQLPQRCFSYSMKSVHWASALNYSSAPIQLCLEGDHEKGLLWITGQACRSTVETDQRLNQHVKRFIETWSLPLEPPPPPTSHSFI